MKDPHRATYADGREEEEDHGKKGEGQGQGGHRGRGRGAAAWLTSTGGLNGPGDHLPLTSRTPWNLYLQSAVVSLAADRSMAYIN